MSKVTKAQFNSNVTLVITMPHSSWVRLGHLVNAKGHINWESYREKQLRRYGNDFSAITDKVTSHEVADRTTASVLGALAGGNISLDPEVVPDEVPIVIAGHRAVIGQGGVQVGCTTVSWDTIRKLAEKDPQNVIE